MLELITASYNPTGLAEILVVEGHSSEKGTGEEFAVLCAAVSTLMEFTEYMLSRINQQGKSLCVFDKNDDGFHSIIIDKPENLRDNEKEVESWFRASFILSSAAMALQGLSMDHPKLIRYKKPQSDGEETDASTHKKTQAPKA